MQYIYGKDRVATAQQEENIVSGYDALNNAVHDLGEEVLGGEHIQLDQTLQEVGKEADQAVKADGNAADKEQELGVTWVPLRAPCCPTG